MLHRALFRGVSCIFVLPCQECQDYPPTNSFPWDAPPSLHALPLQRAVREKGDSGGEGSCPGPWAPPCRS